MTIPHLATPYVTMVHPISHELIRLPTDEAKRRLRYGWRYATYDECLAAITMGDKQ